MLISKIFKKTTDDKNLLWRLELHIHVGNWMGMASGSKHVI